MAICARFCRRLCMWEENQDEVMGSVPSNMGRFGLEIAALRGGPHLGPTLR